MNLTENHLLLLEKHSAGTRYRQILAELRYRGIDAQRQQVMYDEIKEAIVKNVKTPSESSKLLSKRRQ